MYGFYHIQTVLWFGHPALKLPGLSLRKLHVNFFFFSIAIFCVMENVLQLPSRSRPCLTAVVCRAIPGRIFVESETLQDTARMASGIDELNPAKVQMVAEDKRTKVLAMDPAPWPRLQGWVWLRRNTKKLWQYKGDLALVVGLMRSNLLNLWLIPCLDFNLGQKDTTPAAQLFNIDGVTILYLNLCITFKI